MLQVSCDCVSETFAWLKQQQQVEKYSVVCTLPIYCYHVSPEKLLQGYEERLYLVSVTLRHTK